MAGFPDLSTLISAVSALRPSVSSVAPSPGISTQAVAALKGQPPGSPNWNSQNFVQEFLQNKRNNPDALYDEYLTSVQMPKLPAEHKDQSGLFSSLMGKIRGLVPFVDSQVGHQDLNNALSTYPFTPEAKKFLARHTVIRDSMDPAIVEEEANTDPEKYFGISTGRDRMDIATQTKDSPLLSVVTHEMMHSYLDNKGYPYGQAAFLKDWNTAKKSNKLLSVIDQWVASSPDYSDEMNEGDITQERYAYLAQALGGGGLGAFPKELQRHYAPIFQAKK